MRPNPRDLSDIKTHNTNMILELIRHKAPISRADIAKTVRMSPTSITRIVTVLEQQGLVRETHTSSGKVGRKAVMLDTVADGAYMLGVQIDAEFLRASLVDVCGGCHGVLEATYPPLSLTPQDAAGYASDLFTQLLIKSHISAEKVFSVGVGVIGMVNRRAGVITSSPQLGWFHVPLAEVFSRQFGIPVFVENDVKANLAGERFYISEDRDMAILSIGAGMGAAACSGGKTIRGLQNSAGEVGHIVVDTSNRVRCDCGRIGCLQTYIVEGYLVRQAQQFAPEATSLAAIKAAYDEGQTWARNILVDCCRYIRVVVDILTNMYNPSEIITCGRFFDTFGEDALQLIASGHDSDTPVIPPCPLNYSHLGDNGCVVGAALVAREYALTQIFREASAGWA